MQSELITENAKYDEFLICLLNMGPPKHAEIAISECPLRARLRLETRSAIPLPQASTESPRRASLMWQIAPSVDNIDTISDAHDETTVIDPRKDPIVAKNYHQKKNK